MQEKMTEDESGLLDKAVTNVEVMNCGGGRSAVFKDVENLEISEDHKRVDFNCFGSHFELVGLKCIIKTSVKK